MIKRVMMPVIALVFLASLSLSAADKKEGTWHGWVTDTQCGAKGAKAGHAACSKVCVGQKGAKYALYNTADKKVYVLDSPDVADHAGERVTVKGVLDGDTIHATSISKMGGK